MYKIIKKLVLGLVCIFIIQFILSLYSPATESKNDIRNMSVPSLSLNAFSINENSVELTWEDNQKNGTNAVKYDIYRNDSLIESISSFAYIDEDLFPNTSYTYFVKAKDSKGNIVADSNELSITTKQTNTVITTSTAISPIINISVSEVAADDDDVTIMETTGAGALYKKGPDDPNFKANRFIIKYKNVYGSEKFKNSFEYKSLKGIRRKDKDERIDVVTFSQEKKLYDFLDEIKNRKLDNEIEYVQPDYEINLNSSDPLFESQWALENKMAEIMNSNNVPIYDRIDRLPPHLKDTINRNIVFKNFLRSTPQEELIGILKNGTIPGNVSPEVLEELANHPLIANINNSTPQIPSYSCDAGVIGTWDKSTGSGTVVAIIDTGIDITHEDIHENIWANPLEIPNNGIDDDKNGYIDDVNGWNFADETSDVSVHKSSISENHGTHIAGIIAAVKDNGKGIAGVAPSAKIMPLKVFTDGKAFTSDIINAIKYAEIMGAKVVNCSWGSTNYNPILEETISISDMIFVCAAGNSSKNIDNEPIYPASFSCPNIITVASIKKNGNLSSFSNYGENSVDVAAPGEEIQSAIPFNSYGFESGTSMSTAFVSGAISLLLSGTGNFNFTEIKNRIINCSDHLSSLTDKVYNSSKINCYNTLENRMSNDVIQIPGNVEDNSNQAEQNSNEFSLLSVPSIEGQFVAVACGGYHTLALKYGGTVWSCGSNSYGQLGDGTTSSRNTPVQVSGLSEVVAISSGENHSLALKSDGTIWAWGYNSNGQLGDGTTANKTIPVQVNELNGITAISAGYSHSLALKNDGTVWAWGNNSNGQLGDGTTISKTIPVQVNELNGITAISAGYGHSLALKSDGTVWAWGNNAYGQLGDGTNMNSMTPVMTSGLTGIIAIAGSNGHSTALKEDSTVWTWGNNNYGQLGDGTVVNRKVPVQVSGFNGVTAISNGSEFCLALKSDNSVWAWGRNYNGQLGDGTTINRTLPVQVIGLGNILSISGGKYHCMGLKKDGTVWGWGYNYYGEIGDGSVICRTTSVELSGIDAVNSMYGGGSHNFVIRDDDTVWAWGSNECGQLGDGTKINKYTPTQISGIKQGRIAPGFEHTLEVDWNGNVRAWGSNEYGQLGDGTTVGKTTPVQVNGLNGVIQVACGYYHSLALKSDGTVWAWGYNEDGELGNGSIISSTTPVQVIGLSNVSTIACGYYHSLAVKNDGTVWAWGYNGNGQLGDGTTTDRLTPVQVIGLSGVFDVDCGSSHSVACKSNRTVWAWGYNGHGQLGDGTKIDRLTPVQVPGLTNVNNIECGSDHSLVYKDDTAWAWGANMYGQLGDGTTTSKSSPVQVIMPVGLEDISSGAYYNIALTSQFTIRAWGYNYYGELGNGEKGFYEYAKWSFGTSGNIPLAVATPIFCPDSGTYTGKQSVTITCFTAGAKIYYTLDGTTPTTASSIYSSPISVTTSTTIKAMAIKSGMANSDVASALYTIQETPSNTVLVNCSAGKVFNYSISGLNIKNLDQKVFTVNYDTNDLDVLDLCMRTLIKETVAGNISEVNVDIIEFDKQAGRIKFRFNKTIASGMSWSGTVNIIQFKCKVSTGTTLIEYSLN